MKTIYTIIISFAFCALFSQTKEVNLDSYTEIDVSGGFDVMMSEGSPRAEISMNKGDIEDVIINVKGNTLYIKFAKSWGNSGNRSADIKLYGGKNITSIEASAAARIENDYTFITDHFEVDASSAANISVAVECDDMEVELSSAARLDVEGSATHLEVDASSAATYKGVRLLADHVDAEVSSAASVKVYAKKSIEADASSGGTIRYKGNPSETDIDSGKMSGGSVKKI